MCKNNKNTSSARNRSYFTSGERVCTYLCSPSVTGRTEQKRALPTCIESRRTWLYYHSCEFMSIRGLNREEYE